MDFSITKISQNGQVVIPSEIRKAAGVKAGMKFPIYIEKDGRSVLIKDENLIKKINCEVLLQCQSIQ